MRFGDKWAGMVIRCLEGGPRRFSELRVPLRGVTAKVLTRSLRKLAADGLIRRSAQARRVEYELTPLGRSLLGPMEVACAWAREHWEELLDAREGGAAAEPTPDTLRGRRTAAPERGVARLVNHQS
ncbi:winged helix-turn-helix transcriptional regulator [Micromonospora solifontis]|uniref:winged helix-turn-helix transcriptional regulator n=1 Tax=Micromonospora solifontis TaxID=2487138 RepID=UPI0021053C34|nr:helix-turn-helix domain-containing protein [Micromonospora solifontis]